MKFYSKRVCPVCKKIVSCAGVAWVQHSRMHVREGVIEEILDWDNRITFRQLKPIRGKSRRRTEMKRTKQERVKQYTEEMQNLQNSSDLESTHCIADDLLCDLLREIGYGEVVNAFENLEKWYA
jgi:hypothetical protein